MSAVKGARLGGLLARAFIGGAAAVIVVVATVLTWPWSVVGPSADERRIQDLQRLSHAVGAFRARQHVLPASLARLPIEPAAPVHAFDPITNRPYDYRPLGPLAYELCARFDAAGPDERRDSWWHDAGRYCFPLETRDSAKPPAPVAAAPVAPARPPEAEPEPGPQPGGAPDAPATEAPTGPAPAPAPVPPAAVPPSSSS